MIEQAAALHAEDSKHEANETEELEALDGYRSAQKRLDEVGDTLAADDRERAQNAILLGTEWLTLELEAERLARDASYLFFEVDFPESSKTPREDLAGSLALQKTALDALAEQQAATVKQRLDHLETRPAAARDLDQEADWSASANDRIQILRQYAAWCETRIGTLEAERVAAETPAAGRTFEPSGGGRPESPLFTPEIRALFDGFDADQSGSLEVSEAQAFFNWVERNIQYRYDDELVAIPVPGTPVGDGRPGPHYQQTPAETLAERYGDCEDMNNLEVAFYRYWNVYAVQGLVNAKSTGTFDHAVALVLLGDHDTARRTIGTISFYPLTEQHGVPRGDYLVVDNAYSGAFGYISGGTDPGQFILFDVVDLGEAYDAVIT